MSATPCMHHPLCVGSDEGCCEAARGGAYMAAAESQVDWGCYGATVACRRRRTNPCIVSTSGYCFCYPCAFGFVLEHGCCPVTRLPASLDHIRKLYEAT